MIMLFAHFESPQLMSWLIKLWPSNDLVKIMRGESKVSSKRGASFCTNNSGKGELLRTTVIDRVQEDQK